MCRDFSVIRQFDTNFKQTPKNFIWIIKVLFLSLLPDSNYSGPSFMFAIAAFLGPHFLWVLYSPPLQFIPPFIFISFPITLFLLENFNWMLFFPLSHALSCSLSLSFQCSCRGGRIHSVVQLEKGGPDSLPEHEGFWTEISVALSAGWLTHIL